MTDPVDIAALRAALAAFDVAVAGLMDTRHRLTAALAAVAPAPPTVPDGWLEAAVLPRGKYFVTAEVDGWHVHHAPDAWSGPPSTAQHAPPTGEETWLDGKRAGDARTTSELHALFPGVAAAPPTEPTDWRSGLDAVRVLQRRLGQEVGDQ